MSSPVKDFLELSALVKLHLLQEYSLKELIPTEFKVIDNTPKKVEQPIPVPPRVLVKPVVPQEIKPQVMVPPAPKLEPNRAFVREQVVEYQAVDLNDIKAIMLDQFPKQEIVEDPAQFKRVSVPAQVLILTSDVSPKIATFLENLSIAISNHFGLAKVMAIKAIEREKGWEALLKSKDLRLILICAHDLEHTSSLKTFYQENLKQGTQKLGSVPLLLLNDLSLYLREARLKAILWSSLREILN